MRGRAATVRIVAIGAAVLTGIGAVAAAIAVFLAPRGGSSSGPPVPPEPAPRWAPPAADPPAAADPGPGLAELPDPDWVASTSAATGIPARALAAYAGAAMLKASWMPECGLAWNTLAGIAAVESDHGRHGGSTVQSDGLVDPPIYGVPLSGGPGIEHIPDSDGGELDGDAEFDRAVGPFQLIPQTWRNWHVDGNADGIEDPHHIDDAALATANYLCRASVGIDTEDGWRAAVRAFNSPDSYLDRVATFAARYGTAAE